jgi:polysaccharide deacetylase family protein (PEP-CTERM system associated)
LATQGDPTARLNAMTVDVEEHFQVAALSGAIRRADWDRLASRVEGNVDRILERFARHNVRATFFTLAWIAERHPAMVRRIAEGGHEIASHGWDHCRADRQTPEDFRADVRAAREMLEDVTGQPVVGYRAASFSISAATPWAHRILEEEGYRYSSSVYPIRHDHYGAPCGARFAHVPPGVRKLVEVPVSTLEVAGERLPCGGGGYFRLLPYGLFRAALTRVRAVHDQPLVFYFHPWEIDPDQPRVRDLSWRARFRHYVNLHRTAPRLERLTRDFRWTAMADLFAPAAPAARAARAARAEEAA